MFCIVSYDITDDRRRVKLSNILLDFGDRVQYSVFECILKDKKMLDNMLEKIYSVIQEEEDSVRVYALCGICAGSVRIIGKGEITKDPDVYIL
jgi:CRISPR-associated protein Cas2